jgi:hypothetical protein
MAHSQSGWDRVLRWSVPQNVNIFWGTGKIKPAKNVWLVAGLAACVLARWHLNPHGHHDVFEVVVLGNGQERRAVAV